MRAFRMLRRWWSGSWLRAELVLVYRCTAMTHSRSLKEVFSWQSMWIKARLHVWIFCFYCLAAGYLFTSSVVYHIMNDQVLDRSQLIQGILGCFIVLGLGFGLFEVLVRRVGIPPRY